MKIGKEEGSLRKFNPVEVVGDVLRTLARKPALLLPFLIPVMLYIINVSVEWVIVSRLHDIELPAVLTWFPDLLFGGGHDYLGLYYAWNYLMLVASFFAAIIVSAWAIQSYWAYIRMGEVSMTESLKKGITYATKMLGARMIAILILLIPLYMVQAIWIISMGRFLGPDEYFRFGRLAGIPVSIYYHAISVFFIFIYQAIIVEKEGALGSLKRSLKVVIGNYWRVLLIYIIPLLLGFPFIVLGSMIPRGDSSFTVEGELLSYWLPLVIGLLLAPVVLYSLTRAYILSVKGHEIERYGCVRR